MTSKHAKTRLNATQDALASIPQEAPHDRLLDFAINLREAIRGKVDKARSTEQVNRALLEAFGGFYFYPPGVPLPEGVGVQASAIGIEPVLRHEVAQALFNELAHKAQTRGPFGQEPPPPVEWLEAIDNSAYAQESWHSGC